MYYEDIGIYFHDGETCNTENPAVRDELWDWQAADLGYDDEDFYIRLKFNVKTLTLAQVDALEQAIDKILPSSYADDYYGDIDTGAREISGYANIDTYRDLVDTLYYFVIDFVDLTK